MVMKKLTKEKLAYIAGFLEGDGCLLAQIVKSVSYRYGFTVRLSVVFYQKKDKHWFFLWLREQLGVGTIRFRNDHMMEYSVVGKVLVRDLLKSLLPYLVLKKRLAILFFEIIEVLEKVQTEADFLEVCKLVDKAAEHTYSKRRINTAFVVGKSLGLPVETEKTS